ncbi:MAG: N-acetylglucosamine-6-phosphate deacetylase [Defluviitaleaceae bacterium]|nr:N-acetylglucosamine-6-phosphate deacetylase [Defluviitaleaceae bacterium]
MVRILTDKSISNGKMTNGQTFLVDEGRIIDCGLKGELYAAVSEDIDLRGLTVMPGFIDTHIHGAMGHDIMDGTYQAINEISTYKLKEGCTSFCPTTVTGPEDKTVAAIKNIRAAMDKGVVGAKIIGAFLEGMFINPQYKGAHPEAYIRSIDMATIKKCIAAGEGCVKSIIIAPELPGALEAIEELTKMGVQVRIGHSGATVEEAKKAVAAGANAAVHTYNAMSPLHHREPGMVGAVLTNPDLKGELICDMVHVHLMACKVLAQAKGPEGVILVSDCMAAGGLTDGEYTLGEIIVNVSKGVSRMPDGTLAGSTTTMLECVKNMHQGVGCSLEAAVQMATGTPAKTMGIFDKVGSLDKGKCADIIGLDDGLNVRFVMVDGVVKYHSKV